MIISGETMWYIIRVVMDSYAKYRIYPVSFMVLLHREILRFRFIIQLPRMADTMRWLVEQGKGLCHPHLQAKMKRVPLLSWCLLLVVTYGISGLHFTNRATAC